MKRPRVVWDDHAEHQIRFHNYIVGGHAMIGVSCVCLTRLAFGTHKHAQPLGYPATTDEAITLYRAHVSACLTP